MNITYTLDPNACTGPLDASEADLMDISMPEELVFDANKLSEGHSYWDVIATEVGGEGWIASALEYFCQRCIDSQYALTRRRGVLTTIGNCA